MSEALYVVVVRTSDAWYVAVVRTLEARYVCCKDVRSVFFSPNAFFVKLDACLFI
jgi:hypothetical protein